MKKAKLVAWGRSQAVRLPKEFRFAGTEVYIERRGAEVVLSPVVPGGGRAHRVKTLGDLLEHFRDGGGVTEEFATAVRESRQTHGARRSLDGDHQLYAQDLTTNQCKHYS